MFVQRTLAEHGDVPVRRSVQDCATCGNPHAVLHRRRPPHAVPFSVSFCVFCGFKNPHAVLRAAPPHAVPYMLRRCVGFSWAKPSVTKSATHLPVFLVFKSPRPARSALFEYFVYSVVSKSPGVLRAALTQTANPRTPNCGAATLHAVLVREHL